MSEPVVHPSRHCLHRALSQIDVLHSLCVAWPPICCSSGLYFCQHGSWCGCCANDCSKHAQGVPCSTLGQNLQIQCTTTPSQGPHSSSTTTTQHMVHRSIKHTCTRDRHAHTWATRPTGTSAVDVSMEHGAWSMEHGAWSMGHGALGMGHGAWGIQHGARTMHTAWADSPPAEWSPQRYERTGPWPGTPATLTLQTSSRTWAVSHTAAKGA